MKAITPLKRIESTATMAAGVLVFHYFLIAKEGGESVVLIWVAIGLLISGLFIKPLGNLITYSWTKLGEGLGWINSRIILSVMFFIVLTPIALLFRLFKKDNLGLKRRADSYYFDRNHTFSGKDLDNIW